MSWLKAILATAESVSIWYSRRAAYKKAKKLTVMGHRQAQKQREAAYHAQVAAAEASARKQRGSK